ncbi:MAG: hypothetical protein HZA91_02375 [Verrucomicrobia bacterium]|nr:hypothetical protein [Verrucomicrobiota bacterium]
MKTEQRVGTSLARNNAISAIQGAGVSQHTVMKTEQRSFLCLRRPSSRRSGQMIVVVACLLVAMLALMGLVTDAGMVQCNRRHAQRAADAAAQAGARLLLGGQSASNVASAISAASYYAVQNGTLSGNVAVEIPPTSSAYFNGSNGYVRVRVTRPVNTTFMRLFLRQPTVNVAAFATAGVVRRPGDLTVLVLRPDDEGLEVEGNATLDVGNGSIHVNTSGPEAVEVQGNSLIVAKTLNIVGGYEVNGNSEIRADIVTQASAMEDPFKDVVAPVIISTSSVRYGDGATGGKSDDSGGTATKPATRNIAGNQAVTLHPGIYWGGLNVSGNASVTFLPGRYVMAGGGIRMTGTGNVIGSDVFIYNTNDPYKNSQSGAVDEIEIRGNRYVDLKAPTATADAYYKGFLIFDDRTHASEIEIEGNGSMVGSSPLSGYIYSAKGELEVEGNGTLGGFGAVVYEMEVEGHATFTILDKSRTPNMPAVSLVE